MFDVAIIGAGVVGGMIARKLSQYNLNVVILEKEYDVAMGASKANSGIVHSGFDAKPGTLKAKLNVEGSKIMESVAKELGVKYRKNGSLVIGFNDEDKKVLEQLLQRGKQNGVEGLEILEREALEEKEPNIGEGVKFGLYAPSGAIICPYELTVASIGNAMDNGVKLKTGFEVTKIEKIGDRYILTSQKEEVEAGWVINAGGIYADKIAGMVGDFSFTIIPRRGEYLLLDKDTGKKIRQTIFRTPGKMGKGILVSPTADNNLLLGPTSDDIEEKTDTATTKSGFDKIISQAKENAENIPFGDVITSFAGNRAVGSTGDFIINLPTERFVNVAGIESPGLSSSPAIGEYVAELLKENGLKLTPNKNYNPIRKPAHWFKELSLEEKNKVIKENPSFGKVVCRCETVTEGEILEALRINPKATDLDGVKRRTRAQMGRCQGGFCGPNIVKLLADEMNVPVENITKFGGGSVVNFKRTKEI